MKTTAKSPIVSVIIVSYNTKQILERCIESLLNNSREVPLEIIMVDNASHDGSPNLISSKYPGITIINNEKNIGFASANNLGFKIAQGKYVVLLNSDAFLHPGSLHKAVLNMDENPYVGLGGAKLVGRQGEWQPSAFSFPSVAKHLLRLSGITSSSLDFQDPNHTIETDWVPGAFSIIRRSILENIGYFDEKFFFYFEEVDLCRRIQNAGYSIMYWPDIVVTHLGGESSHSDPKHLIDPKGARLMLWMLRSTFLYYRKHQGYLGAYLIKQIELYWNRLRIWKNKIFSDQNSEKKILESKTMIQLIEQAWNDTEGGTISPPKPW